MELGISDSASNKHLSVVYLLLILSLLLSLPAIAQGSTSNIAAEHESK